MRLLRRSSGLMWALVVQAGALVVSVVSKQQQRPGSQWRQLERRFSLFYIIQVQKMQHDPYKPLCIYAAQETDPDRIRQREKQIWLGRRSAPYLDLQLARRHWPNEGPVTPRSRDIMPKRTWDRILKAWRRALYTWRDRRHAVVPAPVPVRPIRRNYATHDLFANVTNLEMGGDKG